MRSEMPPTHEVGLPQQPPYLFALYTCPHLGWKGIWIIFVSELILVETCSHTKQTMSATLVMMAACWVANDKRPFTTRNDQVDHQELVDYVVDAGNGCSISWANTDPARDMLG